VPGVCALVSNAVVSEDFEDRTPPSPNFTHVGIQKSVYLRFIVLVVISTMPTDGLDSVGEVRTGIERKFKDIH
jgi:hypothetical protein